MISSRTAGGRVREMADPALRAAIRGQAEAETGQAWEGFDEHALFELGVERCLLMLMLMLMLTRPGDIFAQGPTIWKS